MKSTKIFLIGMLCTVGIYLLSDILKSTIFLINHHGLFIQLKELFVVIAGIITMYFSLLEKFFKIFLAYYGILFSVFSALKLLQFIYAKLGDMEMSERFYEYSHSYLNHSYLFGVTPFIVFFGCLWLATYIKEQQK